MTKLKEESMAVSKHQVLRAFNRGFSVLDISRKIKDPEQDVKNILTEDMGEDKFS